MKLYSTIFWVCIPGVILAQPLHVGHSAPRDTSFTVASAAVKVLAQYPAASVVFPRLPAGVIAREDLVYVAYGDRNLHLDLFRPAQGGPHPGVVLVHGGGWRSGDRSQSVPMAEELAAHGYVSAAVEYRLSTEALYPAAVRDLKAAVRWMRAHGAEFGIDTAKIAILGCSAGGHLAALLGTTNCDPKFAVDDRSAGHSSVVEAVVNIDGILDFTDPAESGKDTVPDRPSVGAYWLGAPYREKPEVWVEASPLVHVDSCTTPIVFINSALPRFHAGRDAMIEKLKALHISYEVHTIPDTPHPFWLFHPWFEPTCQYTTAFLDKVFKTSATRDPR